LLKSWVRWIVLLPLLAGLNARATYSQTQANAPVEIRVLLAPTPFKADGQTVLAYEIHVTNLQSRNLTLNRIEVRGKDAASAPLADLQNDALKNAIERPGLTAAVPDKRVIGGGMRAVVYLWLTIERSGTVPRALQHRFFFTVVGADGKSVDRDFEAAHVDVSPPTTIVLPAPFKGGTWIAGNGPSNTSDHRRALIPVAGEARIAQRFAIDWLKLGENGKGWHDNPKINANWFGYGVEVLAVSDGVATELKDGIPENVPLAEERAVPITLETIAGNHVMLSLGNGLFALYAHLQPGSLRVKTGEHVRRGQVLGLLGSSGNSDAPHLHFHIGNANSPLAAEGLPYFPESFDMLGTANVNDVIEKGWKASPAVQPEKHLRQIPTENVVVRFN
jgi:murein DD-endopeptidase MepM/ murein hydrolase activator NlpD